MTPPEPEKKKWPIPKTVRRKHIVIDGREYDKCPYQDCGFMVEDKGYRGALDVVDEHVRQAHGFVWLNKGKSPGWYPLTKFHPRVEENKE